MFQKESEVDLSDIEKASNMTNNEDLLNSLRRAMVLSNNAKKFAIAQQINCVDSMHVYVKMDVFLLTSIGALIVAYAKNFFTYQSPPVQLAALVTIAALLLYVGVLAEKAYEMLKIQKADSRTAGINEDYMNGGIEFLEKELARNRALRSLVPAVASKYDEQGEKTGDFFEMPLNERLKLLEQLKQECLKNKEQELLKEENE